MAHLSMTLMTKAIPVLDMSVSLALGLATIFESTLVLLIKETGQSCVAARHTVNFSSSDAHLTAEPSLAYPHQDLLSSVPRSQVSSDPHKDRKLIYSKTYQDILSLIPAKPDYKSLYERSHFDHKRRYV